MADILDFRNLVRGGDDHAVAARPGEAPGILARLIDLKTRVRMVLNGGNPVAVFSQLGDDFLDERGLPGA